MKTVDEMFYQLGYKIQREDTNPYNAKKYIYYRNDDLYKEIEIVPYDYVRIVEDVGLSREHSCDIEWNEFELICEKFMKNNNECYFIRKDDCDYITYECSNCVEEWCLTDGTPEENCYNYCPKCGAKIIKIIERGEE